MRYKHTKEELEIVVKQSLGIRDLCRKLNIIPAGGNYKTLNSKIKKWGIDTSHFTGSAWNVGERYKPFGKKRKLEEILVENSSHVNSSSLRKRLLSEGIKENKCECCNLTMWLDKPIKLELHHSNGNNSDHRIENIELLCPNCHSYTDNYRGKNINKLV